MTSRRCSTGLMSMVVCLLLFRSASAQDVPKLDITRLQNLYEQLLENPSDEFLQKLIADEREVHRNAIEDELQASVAPPVEEAQIDESEFPKALERQKNVIANLLERLRERRVDLDLLQTEEERYYPDSQDAERLPGYPL